MRREIAIVVGGASTVWEEVIDAQALVRSIGGECKYFVCNDMIPLFSKDCVVMTLHVDKLPMWLGSRASKGMLAPRDVWICEQAKDQPAALFSTRITNDWGGSVGLFAAKIAIQEYYLNKVILCGVPMTIKGGHFIRGTPWADQLTFVNRWQPHLEFLRKYTRSMSGLTKEWLGEPDKSFLLANVEV